MTAITEVIRITVREHLILRLMAIIITERDIITDIAVGAELPTVVPATEKWLAEVLPEFRRKTPVPPEQGLQEEIVWEQHRSQVEELPQEQRK
jgi:hypothetical protein